ncbi:MULTISPECIES: hypothetical protein [Sporosarcina]|nr:MULTISPECIES: hypothetical protein [Sporosarcina]
MGLMYTTVIGYMVVLGLASLFTMHFLSGSLDSNDSITVDPKPEGRN